MVIACKCHVGAERGCIPQSVHNGEVAYGRKVSNYVEMIGNESIHHLRTSIGEVVGHEIQHCV